MSNRIECVQAMENMTLRVIFRDGTEKSYDVRQMYASFPQFRQLEDDFSLYQSVQVDTGGYGVSWNDDLDLDAEELWDNGVCTGRRYELDLEHRLAAALVKAREAAGITQKELARLTGIAQGDISKLENATANPSLRTLKRLAAGMGMRVQLTFDSRAATPYNEGRRNEHADHQ